jgi:electron transfer flavoprotein alpha subunit
MSVIVYIESTDNKVKKSSVEAAFYASETAKLLGTEAIAIALGTHDTNELAKLGNVGVSKVLHDSNTKFDQFDTRAITKAIAAETAQVDASVIAISYTQNGKAIAPRVSVRLQAGMVAGAISLPNLSSGFVVRKNVFSGKAMANVEVLTPKKVIALTPNSVQKVLGDSTATVESFSTGMTDADFTTVVKGVEKASGTISLTEAEIVVSGGRGLKGPENWGPIEALAKELGAATACSRPVADVHWRPHAEHVGQTGFTIRPNLYIAAGISGAIQHLAGVNGSKVIVVINTDAEAPFFKAADYGIVGDAQVVLPKLVEAYKNFKASAH